MKLVNLLFGSRSRTYTDAKGYQRFSDSHRLVHRWAAEKKEGKKLKKGQVVHHKDRNKRNNSPGNLHVFASQKEHDRVHRFDAKRFGKAFSYRGKNPSNHFWSNWF